MLTLSKYIKLGGRYVKVKYVGLLDYKNILGGDVKYGTVYVCLNNGSFLTTTSVLERALDIHCLTKKYIEFHVEQHKPANSEEYELIYNDELYKHKSYPQGFIIGEAEIEYFASRFDKRKNGKSDAMRRFISEVKECLE